MRQIMILAMSVVLLAGCEETGKGAASAPSITPVNPANPNALAYTSKSTTYVNSGGDTFLTLHGDFDTENVNGMYDNGDYIASIVVGSVSGKVCAIQTMTPHAIDCIFDARYIGDNPANGYEEIDEVVGVHRVMHSGLVEDLSVGTIQFKKMADLRFGDVNSFNLNVGPVAGQAAGWWSNVGALLVPYATTYTLTNAGVGNGDFTFYWFQNSGLVEAYESDCGATADLSQGGTFNYYHGTLTPGQVCHFSIKLLAPVALAGHTIGTEYGFSHVRVTYDDHLGNTVTTDQNIHLLYSN